VRKVLSSLDRPIHLVFGGFHLCGTSPGEVQQVIRELKSLGVTRVGPTHCTGEGPTQAFREAFGAAFEEMGAGRVVRVGAARRDDVVWFEMGRLRGALVTAGQFDMNVATLLPEAAPADLEQEGLSAESIVFTIRSLYLEKGGHRVIVDPGGLDPERLVTTLRSAGIDPAGIDTVIITHAHMDHCAGGVTPEGGAAFPNARYFIQKREWDHWMAPDNPEPQHVANFRRLLVPIRDRFTLLEGDSEIVPGIEGVRTPGHSPGHMVVLVGKELAYTGDALLQPAHVAHPEWTATFDLWPTEIVESRRAFLARLAADGPLVVGTHFPAPGTGRVRAEGEGWRWVAETLPEVR
jgi:glyoxylase-like metal-dependent hydrolase (beta-lactamase superfamily II)